MEALLMVASAASPSKHLCQSPTWASVRLGRSLDCFGICLAAICWLAPVCLAILVLLLLVTLRVVSLDCVAAAICNAICMAIRSALRMAIWNPIWRTGATAAGMAIRQSAICT